MDAQKRKALIAALGYLIERDAKLPERTEAELARMGIKTAAYYEQVLTRLVKTLYHGDIDLLQFTQLFGDLVEGQLTRAWYEGMQANGLTSDDMTDEWQAMLDKIILDEKTNIGAFADEIVSASNLTGEPLQPFLDRVDMWSNRYDDVVNQATIATAGDGKLKWVYGDTDHCSECEQLNGVVAFASEWDQASVYPQQPPNDAMTCGGWRCQCHMEPTTDRRSPNALDKIIAIALGPTGKSVKAADAPKDAEAKAKDILDSFPVYSEKDLPPQLQEDPNSKITMKHAKEVIKDHDPVELVFAYGTDIVSGKQMTAEQYDGPWVRNNIWQDATAGINPERYHWWKKDHYGIDSTTIGIEVLATLLHETTEALEIRLLGLDYGDAHSLHANPIEFEARHGNMEDVKKRLRELGWDIK